MSKQAKGIILRLPEDEHRALKTFAAMRGESIQSIIVKALGLYYRTEANPTNSTAASFQEV